MALPDYMPKDITGQIVWLENYCSVIHKHGPTCGLSAEEVAATQKNCLESIRELQSAASSTGIARDDSGSLSSTEPAPEFSLQALPIVIPKNPEDFWPRRVSITFDKRNHQGIWIEMRRGPNSPWRFIAASAPSPYIDSRPPLLPYETEPREYRVRFLDDGKPTGCWSEPKTVLLEPYTIDK